MSPLASLYVCWLFTGAWPLAGRLAGMHADPLLFATAGLGGALLLLLPWLAREDRWRRLFAPALLPHYLVIGGLGSGATSLLLLSAVRHTSPANAAIVGQVEVVYSAVLASLLLRERVTWRQGAASCLVLAGTALVLGGDLGTPHWKGDVLMLIAPALFQISHAASKKLPPEIDAVTIAGIRQLYGFLALAPFAARSLAAGGARFSLAWPVPALLAFQAVVLNALNNVLWYRTIRALDLSKTTAIMLSYPCLTLLYSWLLGVEPIGSGQLAGLALSFGGALWLTWQVRGARGGDPAPAIALAEPA